MNLLPRELRVKILRYASSMDDRIRRHSIGRLDRRLQASLGLVFERTTMIGSSTHIITSARTGSYIVAVHSHPVIGHTTLTYWFGGLLVREEYLGRLDRSPEFPEVWRYRHVDFPWAEDVWHPGQLYDPLN